MSYNSTDVYHPDAENWDVKTATGAERSRMIAAQQKELVRQGLLELPDGKIKTWVFVQTITPGRERVLNCTFQQGIDMRWYYEFKGTDEHYGQFKAIMASYGVRDVEAIRSEEQAAAIVSLTELAIARYGKEMGTLLSQGLCEGVLSISQYHSLVPPLHRRIIYAVRLTVERIVAYTSALFNKTGDETT